MSKFKDRLWRELVHDHGEDLAQIPRPGVKRSRRARPRVLAGTSLGLAGVSAAVTLAVGAASTAPAFAVTPNHDGTVQVVIFRRAGIAGANAKLSAMGIRARIVAVSADCQLKHRVNGGAVTLVPRSLAAETIAAEPAVER